MNDTYPVGQVPTRFNQTVKGCGIPLPEQSGKIDAQPRIPKALGSLHFQTEQIEAGVMELEKRLDHVLGPVPPQPHDDRLGASAPEIQPQSGLENEVVAAASRLRGMSGRLNEILARLQLAIALLFALCVLPCAKAADAKPGDLFRSGEFSGVLGGSAAIGTAQREKEAVVVSTVVGADYFATKNLGLGVRGELSDFSHSVLDRASGRVQVRAPLWDRVAPYGYVEGGFNFEQDRVFAGAGGGAEVRFTKNSGAFGELGLETTTRGAATGRAAAGVRLGF